MDRRENPAAGEHSLVRQALDGDRTALQRLLSPHEPALRNLCRSMLRDPDDADDAVQESFLRALRALSTFQMKSSFRTWLFRIAINLCLEWKRRQLPIVEWSDGSPQNPQVSLSPEAQALRQLRVREALQSLPPRCRAILLLKEVEGWTAAEIASVMRCTQRRVYHELGKAHRGLAEWRQGLDEGDE